MSIAFAGIFLTSARVAETAEFYMAIAGLSMEAVDTGGYVYWRGDCGGVQLAIHDARSFADYSYPPLPDSNVTHLYFRIDSQADFLARLDGRGLNAYAVDDVVVTVVDPDGRKVMFGTA